MAIPLARVLNQDKGVLASRDGLRLSATELFNGAGGLLSSQKGIDVSLAGAFDNGPTPGPRDA